MLIFNGDQKFESFYLKHFDNFEDLQNCTECFKNLAIYSQSIYYQSLQNDTGSFKRILTENDSWLDDNFWKNGGNNFTSSFILGTLNNNPLNFITSGSVRIYISTFGNISISKSLDISENLTINGQTTILSTLYDSTLEAGNTNQFLRSNNISGAIWTTPQMSHINGLLNYTSSVSSSLNSLNVFTSSVNTSLTGLNSYTSSLNTWTGSFSQSVYTQFQSVNTSLSSLNSFSSSINIWTGSVSSSLNFLNSYTSSLNIATGSFFKQGGNSFGQSGSLGTNDNNNLHIITSGSTRLFISSSGAIGLGTLTPVSSYLITANGNTLISNGRFGTDSLGINIFNYFSTSPRITSTSTLDYLATNKHTWYYSGDLHMMNLSPNGLKISSTNVTASYALDVQGSIGLSGILYVGNTSYGLPLSSGSDGQFLKRSNYLGSFVLNTWANILTSDVTGLNSFTSSVNTSLSSLNSFSSSINIWTGSVNTTLNNFSSYTSSLNIATGSFFKQGGNSFGTNAVLGTNDNYSLSFKTNNSVRMFVSSSGNIGIGTILPQKLLEVSDVIRSTSNFAGFESIHNTGTSWRWTLNNDNSYYLQSSTDRFVANASSRIIAFSNGNFSIGSTVDTGDLLSVNGTLKNTTSAYFSTTSGGVAIGKSSYNYTLDVEGGIFANGNMPPIAGTTGTGIGTSAGFPYILHRYNAGATDSKVWDMYADSTSMVYRIVNDASSAATVWKQIYRSAMNITAIQFPNGNFGIGGYPSTSAKLDITSTTGGVLFPRMTTTQKNAITGVSGLVVYDTTLSKLQVYTTTWENLH